jgi:uncharacterized protein YcbX
MSAEDLQDVQLQAGRTLPGDRRFAIARGSARVDTAEPSWHPKDHFVTLMGEARLATLKSAFDADTGRLTIRRGGKPVSQGKVTEATGRVLVDQFFAAYLDQAGSGAPKLIDSGNRAMTDNRDPVVSLINLASVRDLERVVGRPVDPIRFRANIYIDGLPAWAEMSWIGQELRIGDCRLSVVEPIERCAATTVNPDTAERDINIPKALQRGYRHVNMGIYARLEEGGRIAVGAAVTPPDA